MKAYSKLLIGAVTAITLLSVACGKSKGSGDGGGTVGFNCIDMNGTCVTVPQGYIGRGTWNGNIGNDRIGSVTVRVTLNPTSGLGAGGWGNGWSGGGYYGNQGYGQPVGNQVTQTYATVTIRTAYGFWEGRAIANGTVSNFTVQIPTQNGQSFVLNGQFTSTAQTQMNVQVTGVISASGAIFTQGTAGIGNGSGYGYGYDSGYGYSQPYLGY